MFLIHQNLYGSHSENMELIIVELKTWELKLRKSILFAANADIYIIWPKSKIKF